MHKKVLAMSLAIIFILAGFFCWKNTPAAQAVLATNMFAEIVVGQGDMTSSSGNQGNSNPSASTLKWPNGTWTDGKKLLAADTDNNRILIYNTIPQTNNASADVVIGQSNMTSRDHNQGGSPAANTLYDPDTITSDGIRLFVADKENNRVLIYNTIPTSNNASADVVIGQQDFAHNGANQGGTVGPNTLSYPYSVYTDGTKLFIADGNNNRVLIYNTIPTSNNASADVVIGQQDFTHKGVNQGGSVSANTLHTPTEIFISGGKMIVTDASNNRVLIYNSVPTVNNPSADVVVGQANLTSNQDNQNGNAAANTLYGPFSAVTDGTRLFISDYANSRILVFNNIPTTNNASANFVIGQPDFSSNSCNQGGSVAGNNMCWQGRIFFASGKLYVGDPEDSRILIFSIDSANTWQKNKSKSFYGGIKGKLKKKNVAFSGKKTDAKKGRVYVYRNGVLKKTVRLKKSGSWKLNFAEKQRNINVLYQFRFYSAANQLVNISDQFNVYLK